MDIAYAAHTESCTFMLDADGVCRWVVASNPVSPHKARHWEKSQQAASRCIGAQYVASLDVSVSGGLVDMPRLGVPMIFARVDENGRVSLVRTGPVLRFEDRTPAGQAAHGSGMRERPHDDPETRRIPRGDDGEFDIDTTPRQAPLNARPPSTPPPRRSTLPPAPPPQQRNVSRLPPPPAPLAPIPRARSSQLPPPPMNHRASANDGRNGAGANDPRARRADEYPQGYEPAKRDGYAAPLWSDRAQVALRRAR